MKKIQISTILMTAFVLANTVIASASPFSQYYKSPANALGVTVKDGQVEGIVDIIHGIYVEDVEDDSPVKKAGIKPGELISAVNGKDVKNTDEFYGKISYTEPGDKLILTTTYTTQRGLYKETDYIVRMPDFR